MSLAPRYSIWEVLKTTLALGMRALEEVRVLARDLREIEREPGPRGEKGQDGAGFNNLEKFEDDVYFGINFRGGDEVVKELRWLKPTLADAYIRVWKEGTYRRGTLATLEGSLFIAMKETETKPGVPGSDWVLAVKRGRDGKDGKPGDKGEKGLDGKPGRDGRTY